MGSVNEGLVRDTMSCIKPGTRGVGVPGDSGGPWGLGGAWGLGGSLGTRGVPGDSGVPGGLGGPLDGCSLGAWGGGSGCLRNRGVGGPWRLGVGSVGARGRGLGGNGRRSV